MKLTADIAGFLAFMLVAIVMIIAMRGGVEGFVDVARLLARVFTW